jgi:hypothetical protein
VDWAVDSDGLTATSPGGQMDQSKPMTWACRLALWQYMMDISLLGLFHLLIPAARPRPVMTSVFSLDAKVGKAVMRPGRAANALELLVAGFPRGWANQEMQDGK